MYRTGRLFFGRVSVMALALGTTPESEFMLGLSKISGVSILAPPSEPFSIPPLTRPPCPAFARESWPFFTSWSLSETLGWFESFSRPEFARMGEISAIDLFLPARPVTNNDGQPFPHSMEPQLRKLGLATRMVAGVPNLAVEHGVCRKGDKLTSEQVLRSALVHFYILLMEPPFQAQLLKLRGDQTATFKVALRCMWDQESGKITGGQPAPVDPWSGRR